MVNPVLLMGVSESSEEVKGVETRVTAEEQGTGTEEVSAVLWTAREKRGLTGEPERIDRPASSCQRELIWHQQSLCVKQQNRGGRIPAYGQTGTAASGPPPR